MKRIFSLILALMAVQMMFAAKITVTNTSDDVEEEGSLRWACKTATAEDTIVFKFSTKGDKTIHISSYLSTKAAIDGSTWADSIIIDGYDEENGTKGNFSGLTGNGPFVKNIIVQNCYDAIWSSEGTNFYDCIARNCSNDGFCIRGGESFVGCSSYNNGSSGFSKAGGLYNPTAASIEQCEIINNGKTGIYCGVLSLKKCHVYDNNIGLILGASTTKIVSDCVISGNDSIGIFNSGMYRIELIYNNIIGLSEDQKKTYPNGTGIVNNGSIDTIRNNVISGNRKNGVENQSARSDLYFTNNYIGTNKYFDQDPLLGNGEDGFIPSSLRSLKDFSDNYFGNNGGYGINSSHFSGNGFASFEIILKNSYFGITPDGKPMPNRKGGISWASSMFILDNCHIGYNNGAGYEFSSAYSGIKLNVKGGSIIHNEGNGIEISVDACNLKAENVTFDSNGESAIYMDLALNMNKYYESLLSDNKFLHTNKAYPAFKTTNPYPVPEFTSCKMTEKTIVIEGKIDTTAKAKIELFYTSQGEQTAEMLVDSFYTNADGTFSDTLDRSMFVGKSVISFNATATYGKITSPLSDVVYPELGKVDLTRTEFYVKTDGYGDGSSWDKAMSPQTFAYYLPQAKDGSTFYVAEGTYYPMYDSNMKLTNDPYALYTIKSDVTIKGGYPANATKGAKSDPKEYKTIFSGDYENDDEVEFVKGKSIEFRNYEDNAINLFKILVSKNINVTLEGCVLSHCSSESVYMYEMVFDNFLRNISFNNVVFESIKGDAVFLSVSSDKHDKVNLSVDHSSFYHNNQCISATLSSINVRNTVFEENGTLLTGLYWNENCQTVIDSCIFGSNLIGLRSWNDLTIKNSTFDSNNSSNLIDMQGYDQVLNVYDSRFIKNKTSQAMIYSQNIAMIENCSFRSNESGSQITWVKDLTVNHSYVYDHIGTGIFYANDNDNLSLNSDTIESCKLESYVIQSGNCRIDSCLIKNNDSYLFYQRGNLDLLNTEITGNYKTDMDKRMSVIDLFGDEEDVVNIYNTIFEDNKYKDCVFLKNEGTFSLNFDHCLSDSNESSQYFDLSNPKSNILNSTFDNCVVTNGSLINVNGGASLRSENSSYVNNTSKIDILHKVNDDILNKLGDSLILRNNTIAKNTSENTIYDFSSVYSAYMNNTIVGNMVSSPGLPIKREAYCDSFDFVGNIILGNGSDVYEKNTSNNIYPNGLSVVLQLRDKTANITYNLSNILRSTPYTTGTDYSTWKPLNNTNLLVKPYELENESGCIICPYAIEKLDEDVLSDIFEGTYNSKLHLFDPVIEYNGGFTPTIALKSDKLSDGTSIRFPRLDNVLTDQRGVARFDLTCMGAYEIGCGSDTTFSVDTVQIGTKIYGQTFTKVGVHDSVFENLKNAIGCDSIVMHKVIVTPDPKTLNYYVKMKKEGDGDGRDWDNAMDGDDFATYLPLAPDGVTFYVAAGEYRPVYDYSLAETEYLSSRQYTVNSDVTIRGGYPADAKGKDVPSEPAKYKTIFSGEFGDNSKSGVQTLFLTAKEKHFSVYGLNFVHTKDVSSSSAAIISNGIFTVNQCVFDSCFCAILLKKGSSAFIDSSLFTKSWAPSVNVSEEASLIVSNSKFEENILSSNSKTPVYHGAAIYSQGVINVDKCIFENNRVGINGYPTSGGGAIAIVTATVGKNKVSIKHSYFKNNSATHGGSIYLLSGDSISIDGCTFVDNYTLMGQGNVIYSTARGNNTLYKCLSNNTFYKNDDKEYFRNTNVIEGNDITHVVNNTFVNNHVPCFNLGKTLIEGNIIISDTTIGGYLGTFGKSNLVSDNISVEGVISVPFSEFGFFLDGVYDLNNNTFIPNFADNGGFTPTIALKSDKLSDGKSIRFPRLENVLTDQRGFARFDETCMGAYELGCGSDTTFSVDTVQVGTKIYGQTFTKVGVHDSIFEMLKSATDCDSIVMHKVIVTPDPKTLNYYVKMKKEGDGDGRDWDNAMDSVDFAMYLPLAPDGVTFYVAEGEYRPVYDYSLAETESLSSRQYTVNSDVTIRGGYPADAKGKDIPSNPKKYKTIFDGLIKSGKDEANVNNLFYTSVVKDLKLNFDGVILSNSSYAIVAYNDNKYPNKAFDVNLDNVSFENNTGYGILSYSYKGSVNIDHSVFENNNQCVYSSSSDVIVKNSSFEKNGPYYLISIMNSGDSENKECTLHIDSSSFVGNTGYIQAYNELIIKNSKFDSNETSGNLISTWSSSDFPDFKVDFINNTFVGNKIGGDILENYGNALTTVERCVFADNECGNDMLRASSMSVNNSNALRNVVKSALFNIYVKSSFISDTIENCTANDIVKYSSEGCMIDSCLIKNNDAYLLSFTPNAKIGNLKYDLLNSEVVGNTKSDMDSEKKVIDLLCSQPGGLDDDSVNIVRTIFRNNKYKECRFISNFYTFLNFNQCLVDSNEVNVFLESRFSQSHIFNSTFKDNNCDIVSQSTHNGQYYSKGTGATYMNNTLVRNKCRSLIDGYYSNSTYVNNTIVGNVGSEYIFEFFHNPAFIGNIVFGNTYKNLLNGISVADENMSSNVMPTFTCNFDISIAGGDYHIKFIDGNIMSDQYYDDMAKDPTLTNDVKEGQVNHLEDLTSLFEGTYNSETGLFTPVLAYNGGLTPTVALKKDVLADGTSIRFPRLENVLADQRGVERLDLTCMGAYEMKCTPIITELKDTVVVGDSYTFNEKNLDDVCKKVGSYYFSDTLVGAENCDSIVKLSLAVRPQKRETGFYVKVDGTGDGSDWINAMSPKDFAEYLPLVYDGETFHIAAGTFKSTYVDPELGRMYNINSSVTLIGGYPDTVTVVGVPPMPETYTTTLSADVKSGDDIEIYTNRSGDYSLYGFEDNDSILIRVNGTPAVSIYGITLSGVKSDKYGAVTMNDGGTLNLDKCAIMTNNSSGVVASNAKINVTSTLAYHNVTKNGAVFRLTDSELNVEHSSFHENVSSGESSDAKGTVANLTNSQSTFTNNTVANNWADMGAVFALSNSQVSLSNNTLVGNQSIAKEPKGSFVVASDSKSKVTLFGNMIVGNGAQPVDGAAVESEGYNIFSTDFQGMGVEKDMFMGSKDYEFVMDGTPLSGNADVFIANVNDNGGFTPTVAVIESMFDGGAVISIPSSQRKVEFDQRKMVRKDTSCVGAFEFPTYVNYFVKQSPVGDGTGRDWDNAMGDTTFFRYFSIVPSGATFYVAAGTYHPLGDRLYNTDSYKNRQFFSSRPLNVFGGYHPQAQMGAVADPSKYVTLLSSDFNGDDEFTESASDYSVMSYSNYKDNSSYVMTIVSKLAGDVHLKGLTFSGNYTQSRGSSAALSVSSVSREIPVALTIDSCSFEKTYVGIYSYVDSLFVRGCRFDTIYYLGLYHLPRETVSSVLEIENSSFTDMTKTLNVYASKGKVLLQNSTFNNAITLVDVQSSSYNKTVDLSLEMYHNTFGFSPKSYQGIVVPNFVQTTAKGNIFNTNFLVPSDNSGVNAMKPVVSDYNLFVEEPDTLYGAWTLGENDILVSPSDLKGVMPGTLGEKRFSAVSSLEKPENYTKVVALESDVLDEKYVRMPIEEAKVKADQIATERLDLTCLGAYEFFKGRDTVYVNSVDTVCLGMEYDRNGWELQSDTLPEGVYVYGRFMRGKMATDTIDTLTLHVNPFSKILLDQVAVSPTLCHGDGYGEVSFTSYSTVPGSAIVYVVETTGDTLSSDAQSYNSVYNNKELPVGKFDIKIVSQTQCVEDSVLQIEVSDRDSLSPLNQIDDIFTDCANEPTSELSVAMKGFHPTMKFYHNDVEITEETKNDELVYEEDAAVTSMASLNLSNIPVGKHIITAVDACDNSYLVSEFEVSVSPSQLVEMQLVDYSKDSLACGLDSGFAEFKIVSGATSVFTLTSDEGYDYTLHLQGKDTVLVLNDLTRGNYKALLKKVDEKCSDSSESEFSIMSPEPLSLSLTSNGEACAEGAVSVVAEGGRGSYTFHWTDPTGKKFDSTSPVLSEASAGTYTCVVEDSTHCSSHTESLSILPNVEELSELNVDKVETKDITCINGNNGTIEVKFSTDNKQQSVACEVTNDATGEVTKVAGTYKKLNGLLAIRTLAAGSYSYEVYYGSETCRLDTNSIKGNFKISAKAVPFAMKPLAISAPQTCFNPANGTIANTVTGWEDDYKAYMQTKAGAKYKITPEVENGVAKLKVDTLSAGSFYYVVEDACGGKFTTDTVTLPKYEPLSLDILSFTDSVTCARATDAEIKFTVNGGIGLNHLAFVDEKSYTDKGTVVSSDNGKGIHTVAYKSVVEGCKDSIGERIRIAGPDTLAIKFTLTGNCPGSALIPEVTGESAPYSYWWSDGENDIEGTAEFPFEMEEGRTYSLTVSDVHSCDEYTKSFTIPSASELPSVSHVVTPSSEKCYKGNNGNIKVKASISKLLDFAVSATILCVKVDDEKTSFVYQCVLDPDGAYNTPETLSPGYYRVTTRLGSFDCDMGVEPAETIVHVDTLPPLKILPEFQLKPHTCEQANGSAKFFVDGWTYTHTAILLTLNDNIRAEIRPTYTSNYVADFRLKLRHGKYQVIVTDKCGQSDTSEVFEILHKPTFVDNVTSEAATCINEPNGVLDFDVQGWTSNHHCELINNDNKEFGYFAKVTPVEVDESVKLAHFHINTIPAGEWRIKVTNECGDNCQYENLVKVDGIDPYKVELIAKDSKLELVCPYDTDGVIALNVTGGCKDAILYGSTTRKVSYWGPTGMYVDSFIWETVENHTLVPIYDSLNPIVEHDTTFNVAFVDTLQSQDGKDSLVVHYDTVVTQRAVYPQMTDEEGNLMFETIVTIDSVEVKTSVEKYGWLDSLATSPIEYDVFNADPEGFKSGKYKFINLRASTYRFTYKSTLEGCTDRYNFDTEVKKPDDVHLNYAVMPITCSTKSDGEISLAPRRGSKSYSSYFVGHDTTDAYQKNRLYKHDLIDGKDSIVEYKVDDEVQSYQIDQLYDQSDLTSVTWSFSQTKNGKFAQMSDLIFPDSTDFYEEIYYKNDKPTTSPVYSNSHLEKFWNDGMGEYFEANVVSIANLRYGFYEALVVDKNACKYRDTIEVKYPAKPLQIDNVVFDETLAECDPTARQIMTYVSGGWGEYGFSFSDDAPETTGKQQQSDGYRGGEASYIDNAKLEGWGVSPFLAPGTYTVAVYDKNGCIVEAPNKYTVKTTFSLSIDTVETVCSEDDSAAVAIKFLESPASGMTYDVVEYESTCRNDVLDDCREFTLNTKRQNVTPRNNMINLNLSTQKRYIKTHGLFVYENDEKHCGTYVEGTVVDTIPIFKASRKSIKDVTCNGLADGMIELFVNGGKSPYKVQRNSSWNSGDEIALYAGVNNSGLNTLVHEETLTIIDLNDTTKNRDTVIVTNYVQITDLAADSFYLTVIDANGCRSVMGDPANYDEKIFVKQPDPLTADFAASIVCKDPSVTTGGNVFFQNLKGGVAPYTLSYMYDNNGEIVSNTCESVVQIPVAREGFMVAMTVTDANNCTADSIVVFRPGELNIDQYDFWATTWYEFGDVVALIDVCGPDDILDSVAYVFRDETGAVDSRIKILDERMYIYDLESNKTAQNTLLHYADRTKEVVPDLFFKKNFRLRDGLTEDQAKHLHFFKFEDSSVVVTKAEELQDVLAKHSVLMKAYFNGCEYQVDRNGKDAIGVMKPGENDKLDKIGQRYQIISLTGSPNPFGKDETITIRATFSEKVDAKLYFYFIDGKESKHFDISSADIIEKNGELVYSREFAASSLFQSEIPDYVIVFLTTGRDQKSTTLLHSGVIDFSK